MIHFTVPDMSCGACANRISRALQQASLPAEVQVEIDLAARQVRLTQGASAQAAQMVRDAISAAGYTAEERIPAPVSSAVPSASGCCCAGKRGKTVDVHQNHSAQMRGCCA